ncbi:MAG TPA: protein kinase [Thermoanaerobaculia bacterium]|nr:protein kinase [Thermoanaerobaculia bacterium]
MTLVAGSRLGPYEILSPIGAGGMGEVYRAKDPRLGREVAIKVLPASFSQDADRLRRFEQEAKAAGLLNHPNITAVYDIGTNQDGAPYVVQELLEGETLRSLLAAGRLPQRKTIDYALQIVRGLAAAHEKGIVHRDLKPENVFVTNDGRVKILDFGLAKLTHTEEKGPATNLPTASAGTEPGVVMGTLGYMSPEQVRGKPADARSDLFAFGAILYEMLSGNRAFRGDSAADTMSAILREDPPDLSLTNQQVSPGLERILRHCLEKNPEQRFHSAHDVAFALETLSGVSTPRLEPAKSRMRLRASSGVLLAAVAAAIAVGLVAGHTLWRPRAPESPSFRRLTFRRGPVWTARFVPDGSMVVYSASWDGVQKPQLYSTRLESPESVLLTMTDQWVQSISRSGEMLLMRPLRYATGYAIIGTLSQAPLSGSAARDLLEDVGWADFAPDGTSFAVVHAPQYRYRLEFPVGKTLYETAGFISYPRVSPKGDAVAFFDHPLFGDDRGSVAIVDLAGKKTTLSTGWESAQGLSWSANGDEIWFTASRSSNARNLHAVTPTGHERDVLVGPGTLTLQDISRDGRVLVTETNVRLGFFGLFSGETKERDLSGFEWSWGPRLSPDAKTVLFTEQGEAGGPGYSVYERKPDGSPPVRLGEGTAMALSPDGKWVLTGRIRTPPATFVLLPTGAGQPRTFPKDSIARFMSFATFLPDGKGIAYDGAEPGKPARVFVQDLEGGAARPVTPEGVAGVLLSPDGKLLLTQSETAEFALAPIDGHGAPTPLRGFETSDRAVGWTADGAAVYVSTSERVLPARVFRVELATGRRELWKEFTPADPTGISRLGATSVSPDGKTILFGYSHRVGDLYVAEGLK